MKNVGQYLKDVPFSIIIVPIERYNIYTQVQERIKRRLARGDGLLIIKDIQCPTFGRKGA